MKAEPIEAIAVGDIQSGEVITFIRSDDPDEPVRVKVHRGNEMVNGIAAESVKDGDVMRAHVSGWFVFDPQVIPNQPYYIGTRPDTKSRRFVFSLPRRAGKAILAKLRASERDE